MLVFLRSLFGKYFWIQYSSELAYKGQWKLGHFSGYGHLKYKNGSNYVGQFVDGVKHGKGRYSSSSGYEYEGDWFKGEQSGYAKIQYKNGDIYTGNVKNSLRDGFGELYQGQSGRNFKGTWIKNQIGQDVEIKDPNWLFKGSIDFGSTLGCGVIEYRDGSVYVGETKAFKRNGQGILKLANGRTISGIWSNNINVESATMFDNYGFRWDGNLENMQPVGYMKTTRPDGIIYDSVWDGGVMLQSLSVSISKKRANALS